MSDLNINKLILCLDIKDDDRIVLIKEHDLADSNFTITHMIKKILSNENNKMLLLLLHNTIGHYHSVGKKLGYDLLSKIKEGTVKTIEPMSSIFEQLIEQCYTTYLNHKFRSQLIQILTITVKNNLNALKSQLNDDGKIYLIIDDLSHLVDIGVDFNLIITFMNTLISEVYQNKMNLITNLHIGDHNDSKIGCALEYNSDVNIDVAPLRTGRSNDVTGVLTVTNSSGVKNVYHYKALDKEIKTFKPGESLNYLYR